MQVTRMTSARVLIRVVTAAALLTGTAIAVDAVPEAFKRGALEANSIEAVKKVDGFNQEAD